jgi:hypothetical protein
MSDFLKARSSELETRLVDGELVLLDLRSQNYLSLNRTGAELWPSIVAGIERDELVRQLAYRHDLSIAVAEKDLDTLVAQLREAGLLEQRQDAEAPDA